jgi:hypothetical protein
MCGVPQEPADPGHGGLPPDQPTGIQDDADYVGPYCEIVKGRELRQQLANITSPDYFRSGHDCRDWGEFQDWTVANNHWPCSRCGSYSPAYPCFISPSGTVLACWGASPQGVTHAWAEEGLRVPMTFFLRNALVSLWVNGKPLLVKHQEELHNSGLDDDTILAAGVYSEAVPRKIAEALGWKGTPSPFGPCVAYPRKDGAVFQMKPDFPLTRDDGKAAKYETPRGRHGQVYLTPKAEACVKDTSVVNADQEVQRRADQEVQRS